jgi:membrane-bound metal-dependent hydrolase YbcI (DUF457 family)
MPGKTVHSIIGATTAAALAHAFLPETCQDRGLKIAAAAGVGAIAGLVPDILEPAINPNHRALFHSLLTGAAIIYAGKKTSDSLRLPAGDNKSAWLALATFAFVAGYGSHLGADALTPKGLPLIS